MTRLIDADALKAEWYRINDIDETDRGVRFVGYTEIARLIDNAPTVQADGDLISRQNAVKEIDSFCGEVWTESEADFARGLGTALSIVESLPSAEQVTGKLNNPDNSLLTADSEACKEQKSKLDLISRQDALAEFRDGRDVYDIMESIERLPSAEVEDRLYIKIYADDEPSVMAEKLYQICGETQNGEVTEWLKEYFPSTPDSRQRGEWVYGIDDETGEKDCYPWTCSVCNKKYPWQPNFCPNCGADMRGDKNE